jgi:hypothetical protein
VSPFLALAALAVAVSMIAAVAIVALVRSPTLRAMIPAWPARDWRAMIALLASVAGAAVLTWFAWWLIDLLAAFAERLIGVLVRDPQVRPEVGGVLVTIINTLSWGLKLLLGGTIAVLLSLGLAINRRTVKISRSGFEASGGDGVEPTPSTVAGAAAGAAAGAIAGHDAGATGEIE